MFRRPQANLVSLEDVAGPAAVASTRVRRSPAPGLVSLEDVAGPAAYVNVNGGPPAYVRPNYGYGYGYNNYYYNRRPYYNSYYYNVAPCIGEQIGGSIFLIA